MRYKRITLFILIVAAALLTVSCGRGIEEPKASPTVSPSASEEPSPEIGEHTVRLTGSLIDGGYVCDLDKLEQNEENTFSGAYSVLNNWPTKKFYAAAGVTLGSVLKDAGVYDDFRQLTVVGSDGYKMTFTREQVTCARYCFPEIADDSEDNASDAPMMLTYRFIEGQKTLDGIQDGYLMLIFGQENVFEYNSPAFVEDVSEIIVSSEEPGKWDPPYSFPQTGDIASGELVKLQHDCSGLVKIFYTTDGSVPDRYSTIYNPSTYQPELTVPIEITEDVTIKAFASGYGKYDSDVAELVFTVR